jgi:predicted XRE-type DNA-binding protein
MKLRSAVMLYLEDEIKRRGWTQAEAAAHLGVTQPRVSDLLRGKVNLFGLDSLVNMVAAMGAHVELKFRAPGKGSTPRRERVRAAA